MIVHPHQGVDWIRFGMSRVEVARAVNMVSKPFKCGIYGLEEDFFEAMGFSAMYDIHGRCNALGFARGFGTELKYDDYQLFAHPAIEVRKWALARDPDLDPKDGFTSKLLGLGMWADWIDETDLDPDVLQDPAESFLVFRPGYWEEEMARLVAAGLVPPPQK